MCWRRVRTLSIQVRGENFSIITRRRPSAPACRALYSPESCTIGPYWTRAASGASEAGASPMAEAMRIWSKMAWERPLRGRGMRLGAPVVPLVSMCIATPGVATARTSLGRVESFGSAGPTWRSDRLSARAGTAAAVSTSPGVQSRAEATTAPGLNRPMSAATDSSAWKGLTRATFRCEATRPRRAP